MPQIKKPGAKPTGSFQVIFIKRYRPYLGPGLLLTHHVVSRVGYGRFQGVLAGLAGVVNHRHRF